MRKKEAEPKTITDELFEAVQKALSINQKNLEDGKIKWMQFSEQVDYIFETQGVSKLMFNRELNRRVGINNPPIKNPS